MLQSTLYCQSLYLFLLHVDVIVVVVVTVINVIGIRTFVCMYVCT